MVENRTARRTGQQRRLLSGKTGRDLCGLPAERRNRHCQTRTRRVWNKLVQRVHGRKNSSPARPRTGVDLAEISRLAGLGDSDPEAAGAVKKLLTVRWLPQFANRAPGP